MHYTYVIRSSCGRHYIGSTEDVEHRLMQHNSGVSKWTARYSGWHVVYLRAFATRREARCHENELKRMKGGEAFHKLLKRSSGA